MFADPFVHRWGVIATTQRALRNGGGALDNVPGLVKRILRETMWQEYLAPHGEVMHFTAFMDFLASEWGLNTTLAMVQRVCGADLEALDLLDQATTAPHGGLRDVHESRQENPETQISLLPCNHGEAPKIDIVNLDHAPGHPNGNTRTYALRRLRADRPDLHARVLAGELSPHRAMCDAGFRHQATPLETLHTAWRKVSSAERLQFLTEMLTPAERQALITGLEED